MVIVKGFAIEICLGVKSTMMDQALVFKTKENNTQKLHFSEIGRGIYFGRFMSSNVRAYMARTMTVWFPDPQCLCDPADWTIGSLSPQCCL